MKSAVPQNVAEVENRRLGTWAPRKPTPPIVRGEGAEKVSGQSIYAADVALPGMLWGKVLRSPLPHARIVSIDTSRARRSGMSWPVMTA